MKHVSTDIKEEVISKLTFPGYEDFSCVDRVYFDLNPKFVEIISKVASTKTIRIKSNTNECFD